MINITAQSLPATYLLLVVAHTTEFTQMVLNLSVL